MALIGLGSSKPDTSKQPDPTGLVKDATDQSFRADVLEASMDTPILVDFWAPWCGPCRTLTPVIEKVVRAAQGKVKLVKINIDENPAYAGQLRVQSIPAVFAFDKGRPVDGFMGAQPESQIKAFVDRLIGSQPAGVDELVLAGNESLSLQDIGGAAQSFAEAVSLDPGHAKAIAGLAACYVLGGDLARAREVLATVPAEAAKDVDVVRVKAKIALADETADAGDSQELEGLVQQDPGDLAQRFELARAQLAQGRLAEATDNLLDIIARDRNWNEDAARKQLLKVFDAAGPGSEVSRNGRRRLSSILFS